MTAVVLLLFGLVFERHRRLRGGIGRVAVWSSGALFIALALILLAVWIADTREVRWFGVRTGEVHTRMSIVAILFKGCGIVIDGVALHWVGVRTHRLWPFHLYTLIALVGGVELISWEKMCRRNPTLHHWPGEGIHSTPLWEWIVFAYLIAFMVWMAHGRLPTANK